MFGSDSSQKLLILSEGKNSEKNQNAFILQNQMFVDQGRVHFRALHLDYTILYPDCTSYLVLHDGAK